MSEHFWQIEFAGGKNIHRQQWLLLSHGLRFDPQDPPESFGQPLRVNLLHTETHAILATVWIPDGAKPVVGMLRGQASDNDAAFTFGHQLGWRFDQLQYVIIIDNDGQVREARLIPLNK
jgi:hypothetical protein